MSVEMQYFYFLTNPDFKTIYISNTDNFCFVTNFIVQNETKKCFANLESLVNCQWEIFCAHHLRFLQNIKSILVLKWRETVKRVKLVR